MTSNFWPGFIIGYLVINAGVPSVVGLMLFIRDSRIFGWLKNLFSRSMFDTEPR